VTSSRKMLLFGASLPLSSKDPRKASVYGVPTILAHVVMVEHGRKTVTRFQ
ncbi:hypothetical protein BVRB_031930, partial [Beta vulgaris subsp. vulgaris]